jgi:hypothetical protein
MHCPAPVLGNAVSVGNGGERFSGQSLTESTGGGGGERTAVPTIYEVPDIPDLTVDGVPKLELDIPVEMVI